MKCLGNSPHVGVRSGRLKGSRTSAHVRVVPQVGTCRSTAIASDTAGVYAVTI